MPTNPEGVAFAERENDGTLSGIRKLSTLAKEPLLVISTRLLIISTLFVSCIAAQRAVDNVPPVFARHGIHAVTGATPEGDAELTSRLGPELMSALIDLRPHIALLRCDEPHAIQHAMWIWWGVTPDGKRIPLGNEMSVAAEGIKPAEFAIAAPTFKLSRTLMHRTKQQRANPSALPAAVQELEEAFAARRPISARAIDTNEDPA